MNSTEIGSGSEFSTGAVACDWSLSQACGVRTPHPWALPNQPVSRRLLAAAGVSDEMIRTVLRSGRLMRLRRGVFVASAAWPDDPQARHVMMAHVAVRLYGTSGCSQTRRSRATRTGTR